MPDREGEIQWALGNGYFFRLYQPNDMQMIFIDSLYQRQDSLSPYKYSLPDFNIKTDQIISLIITNDDQTFKYTINNITEQYLKDSLRSYNF